jgi:hypothetical protein
MAVAESGGQSGRKYGYHFKQVTKKVRDVIGLSFEGRHQINWKQLEPMHSVAAEESVRLPQ